MQDEQTPDTAAMTGEDVLKEACDRNVPVEVFRTGRSSDGSPARGRLLSINEHELVIEKLQMIGNEFPHGQGTKFDCFFRYGGDLFKFRTTVIESRVAARLNGRFVVPALRLTRPTDVAQGQRRSVFRVVVGGRTDAPKIDVWTSDPYLPLPTQAPVAEPDPHNHEPNEHAAEPADPTTEQNTDAPASDAADHPSMRPQAEPHPDTECPEPQRLETPRDPDLLGKMSDASDTGLAVVIFDRPYTRFRMRSRLWLRFRLPGETEPLEYQCVVCHASPVRDTDARLGLRFVDDGSRAFAHATRKLMTYLTQVQREQRQAA